MDDFKEFLLNNGYSRIKQLDDGTWVALTPLIFTTGLCIGLDYVGWSRRYCFEDPDMAILQLDKLTSFTDIPTGWIAKRG